LHTIPQSRVRGHVRLNQRFLNKRQIYNAARSLWGDNDRQYSTGS
jgi:hypothetical protein